MAPTKLAFLSFTSGVTANLDSNAHIKEREVNRKVLASIAPDREDLLLSDTPIDQLREHLRLRSASPQATWLKQYRRDLGPKLPHGNIRSSVLLGNPALDENTPTQEREITMRRRVLSTSSSTPTAMINISNRLLVPDLQGNVFDTWGSGSLSTTDKLISPRPLGPTHVLVVVNESETAQRSTIYSENVQVAINDLLFTLNAPNLASQLPPRLFKELARVGIKVPHLETFRALIVYMHTHNQAALMRAIVPEWMRDIIHSMALPKSRPSSLIQSPTRKKIKILGMISLATISTTSVDVVPQENADEEEHLAALVKEVALTARELGANTLLDITTSLIGLRDNVEFIGYYGKNLWEEMDITQEILIRAITFTSRMDED